MTANTLSTIEPLMTPSHDPTPLWRRPVVFRLLMVALLAEIGYAILNISTMPVYLKHDRGFGEGIISLVVVAFLLAEALFKGPMGHIADRVGRRRLMVLGPSITIVTSICTMVIPHNIGALEPIGFIVLRLLDGLGAAMLWPAAFALMVDSVEPDERQESMSLLNMCYLLGIALALPIGGLFNDVFGKALANFTGERTPSLYLAALLFIGVSTMAYRCVPVGAARSLESVTEGEGIGEFFASLKRIPQFLVLGMLTFTGIGFPMVIIKLFAEQEFKMTETQFGVLALPGALMMAMLSVPMSKLGERIGRARAVHVGLGLCSFGLTMIALGAFLPLMRTGLVMAVGGLPIGIGFLLTIPAWYASVSEIDPRRKGSNIGSVMTAQGLGAIVGASLGGLMYQHLQVISVTFGHYSPFLGCAICVGASWLLSMKLLHDGDPGMASPSGLPVTAAEIPKAPDPATESVPVPYDKD